MNGSKGRRARLDFSLAHHVEEGAQLPEWSGDNRRAMTKLRPIPFLLLLPLTLTSLACPTRTIATGGGDGGSLGTDGGAGTTGVAGAIGGRGGVAGGLGGAAGNLGGAAGHSAGSGGSGAHGGVGGFLSTGTAGTLGTGGTSSQAGAGGSGTGGAGGSSGGLGGSKAGLGVSCAARTDCLSGFCVDGVCCDSACDGVCEQCSSAGVCAMPATDSACAPVSCPQSTACKTYMSSTLSTNLCKSQGMCKTQSDCPFQYTPVRTPCGGIAPDQMLCDGAGSCKQPTVLCGAVASCPTMPGSCEIVGQGGTQSLPAVSTSCTTSDNGCEAAGAYCVNIACDGSSDCPTGTVCCWVSGGGQSSTCTAAANCTSGTYTTASVMCEPTLGNADCPSGLTCSGDFGATAIFGSSGSSYHFCK